MIETTAVPCASPQDTAGEAVAALSRGAFENATDVVVLDSEQFVGIVPVELLLSAPRATLVSDLVRQCPTTAPDDDVERAAREAANAGARVVVVHRFGTDPAYGSGPLATVIQDICSIIVYFLVAGALV